MLYGNINSLASPLVYNRETFLVQIFLEFLSNDLPDYFQSCDIEHCIFTYTYADDVVLLSESAAGFQGKT